MSGRGRRKRDASDRDDDDDKNGNRKTNNGNNKAAAEPPNNNNKKKRPAPPPPAPKALVNLMQKNKGVMTYFTSLQENLAFDVQKYKDKARHYQALYEQELGETARLKTQQSNNGNKKRRASQEEVRATGNHSSNNLHSNGEKDDDGNHVGEKHQSNRELDKDKQPKKQAKAPPPPKEAIVGDDDFEFESSSDEEDASSKGNNNLRKRVPKKDHGSSIRKAIDKEEKTGAAIDNSMFELHSEDNSEQEEDEDEDEDKAPTRQHKKRRDAGYNKPIDNSMFDLESSDDDDDIKEGANVSQNNAETQTATSSSLWMQYQATILEELVDAYRCLEYVGVNLVTKTTAERDEGKEIKHDNKDLAQEEQEHDIKDIDDVVPKDSSTDDKELTKDAFELSSSSSGDDDDDDEGGSFSFLPDQQKTQQLLLDTQNNKLSAEDKGSEEEDSASVPPIQYERCSNEDVVADILRELRLLSRIQSHYKGLPQNCKPFRVAPLWIPCDESVLQKEHYKEAAASESGDQPADHPIRLAIICIFRALSVMDTYCSLQNLLFTSPSSPPEETWNRLFDDEDHHPSNASSMDPDLKESIRVGMYDRKQLVDQLMESLFGEISESWAVSDRSARPQHEVLLYDEEAEKRAKEEASSSEIAEMDKSQKQTQDDGSVDRTTIHYKLHKESAGPKSQARLSSLIERRIQGKILVHLYLLRKDVQQAFRLVCNYMVSSVPSLELEDYPKLQPLLSLVVLEGMLSIDNDLLPPGDHELGIDEREGEVNATWLGSFLSRLNEPSHTQHLNGLLRHALALCIHTSASIFRLRLHSCDDRITDIARVEFAAYQRLFKSQNSWLTDLFGIGEINNIDVSSCNVALFDQCKESAAKLYDDLRDGILSNGEASRYFDGLGSDDRAHTMGSTLVKIAFHLTSVLIGDDDAVKEVFFSALKMFDDQKQRSLAQAVAVSCCMSLRQIELTKLEIYRQKVGCLVSLKNSGNNPRSECLSAITRRLHTAEQDQLIPLATAALDCCRILSDGESADKVLDVLLLWDSSQSTTARSPDRELFDAITATAEVPTVRVINLKRRIDRMDSIVSHVLESGVMVLKAVVNLEDDEDATEPEGYYFYGGHAIDGSFMKAEDVTSQLIRQGVSAQNLNNLLEACVAPEWRPHDLKPFDRNANSDEHALVRISDSERACALSHVAAWKGVLRTLSTPNNSAKGEGTLFQNGGSIQRLFRHSGFARGPALRSENSNMAPSAVCVVLEDDAILVDRFVESLDRVLEELPRDFHFCSLGYARPKTAPLAKFSTHLGIPTCIWYLTGYIISLEGAKHLLSCLPVRGPVDSWIGLKMCANWDNRFGANVGVGIHSKVFEDAPAHRDLATILNFRAFAALTPLCNQRMGATFSTAGVSEKNWRQKDTDITYSGSENYRNIGRRGNQTTR